MLMRCEKREGKSRVELLDKFQKRPEDRMTPKFAA